MAVLYERLYVDSSILGIFLKEYIKNGIQIKILINKAIAQSNYIFEYQESFQYTTNMYSQGPRALGGKKDKFSKFETDHNCNLK